MGQSRGIASDAQPLELRLSQSISGKSHEKNLSKKLHAKYMKKVTKPVYASDRKLSKKNKHLLVQKHKCQVLLDHVS